MAKRVVAVINDGEPGEALVPVLQALGHEGAAIRLLRVAPTAKEIIGPDGRMIAYIDQEAARLEAEGLRELARVELLLGDVDVECAVRFGDAADQALLEAEAFDADLIALTAAPRGRLARAFKPDTADRVVLRAPVPTLVLREP